ncbi:DHA2 family metal-tetracycline-proton antiporter-like MFS transporter [Bacillus ectoiniformans]|uniref:MFS transporter n=1 Tax=Bacillus ectoiniformans TaxID=1494429 RepID=UPI001958E3CA|nr:MFS transporter [Bacillus ectoiniformans]MBM7648744.1 DHA2 family metal-tetracycline-proton antiporter-like MFS transporter [Bacillus ectoiniformans]
MRDQETPSGLRVKKEGLLYSAIFLNTLITVMNTSMFNVALPKIAGEFQLMPSTTSLIVSSYSIAFALSAILYSKLANSVPLANLLTFGMACLGIGSLAGMAAVNFPLLVAARVIQAMGASSISALSIIISSRYIPFHRRGAAIGRVAAAVTLGFGLGPLTGGVITEYFGWPVLFAVSIISVITIPAYQLLLPKDRGEKTKLDMAGWAYLGAGVASILLWLATRNILFSAGAPFVWLFWRHIHRVPRPFLNPVLIKNPIFIRLVIIAGSVFFINFSILFLSPLMLAGIHGVSNTAMIGFILFPGAIGSSIASVVVGRMVDKAGAKVIIIFGVACMLVSSLILSSFGDVSYWVIMSVVIVASTGFVCITTGVPNFLTTYLPMNEVSTGIGTLQLFQYMGGAFGVTVSGFILDRGASIQAFNPIWHHPDYQFSQAFLFLALMALLAGAVFYSFSKKLKQETAAAEQTVHA